MTGSPLDLARVPRRPVEPTPSHDRPTPITDYNHRCGLDGCAVWVPNHRRRCLPHEVVEAAA